VINLHKDLVQPTANKWAILSCVLLGTFTIFLNNSMLNVSIPSFMKIFHLTAAEAQWIVTGFMIPMMVTMTATGYLSDVLGRKYVYLFGMLLFLTGSFLGAIAWNFHSIVGFRVLQGVGAGLIMPLGISMIFQYFPINERGLATGISGIAGMVAPAVGPTLGGFILQFNSWHMLFLVNIPTGLICIAATLYFFKGNRERQKAHFDYWGFLSVSVGIISLILGVNRLPYGWKEGGGVTLLLLGLGAAGLLVFIWNELNTRVPLIDLRIFRNPVFAVSTVIGSVTTASMFAGMLLIPLLMQEVLHYSALTTGLILFPQALMMGLAMTIGGRIVDRYGPQAVLPIGLVIVALMSFALGLTAGRSGILMLVLLLSIRGLGIGCIHTPATTAGLNALPAEQVSRAMSINNIVGQITASVAVVIFSMFFEARRSLYSIRMPIEEAGILAVQQLFLGLGGAILLVLPVALLLLDRKNKVTLKSPEKIGQL
jgi:EmrB/QacA subfamily drug resistance transporter